MTAYQNADKRARSVRRKAERETFGSRLNLYILLSLIPPYLTLTERAAEILGDYQMPLHTILYIPIIVLIVLKGRHHKRIVELGLREQAVCSKCFYDLTGNESGTCPECGTKIEPP